MSRSIEQLQQQYAELGQKAGELQYKITQDELQLKSINQRIMILNKEYHELTAEAQKAAAPKVEEAAVVEVLDATAQG